MVVYVYFFLLFIVYITGKSSFYVSKNDIYIICLVVITAMLFMYKGFKPNNFTQLLILFLLYFIFKDCKIHRLSSSLFFLIGLYSVIISFIVLLRKDKLLNGNIFESLTELSLCITLFVIFAMHKFARLNNMAKWIYLFLIICSFALLLLLKCRVGILATSIPLLQYLSCYKKIFFSVLIFFCFIIISINKNDSTLGRAFIYNTTLSMIKSPTDFLFGKGYMAFEKDYMFQQAQNLTNKPDAIRQRADNIKHPLNEFLLYILEYGVLSLVLFFFLIFLFIRSCPTNILYNSILFSIIVYALFTYPLRYPLTWVLIVWTLSSLNKNKMASLKEFHVLPVAIFLACLLYNVVNYAYDHYRWEKAYIMASVGDYEKAEKMYMIIEKKMQREDSFLYNYSSFLSASNKQGKAIKIIQKIKTYSYETEMLKGEIFYRSSFFDNAINHFRNASNMCPNRFKPLYEIYNIYGQMGKVAEQKYIAREIITKPIKVDSKEVRIIKSVVTKFLKEYEK